MKSEKTPLKGERKTCIPIKSDLEDVNDVVLYKVEDWAARDIWKSKTDMYVMEQGDSVVVIDKDMIRDLVTKFDAILKKKNP